MTSLPPGTLLADSTATITVQAGPCKLCQRAMLPGHRIARLAGGRGLAHLHRKAPRHHAARAEEEDTTVTAAGTDPRIRIANDGQDLDGASDEGDIGAATMRQRT